MPNPPTRSFNWSKGMNNVAQPDRLPENATRRLVNFDASAGGTLELRARYSRVVDANQVRGCGAVGSKILIVDENGLTAYDTSTNSPEAVAGTIGEGKIAMVAHNHQLYISTPAETWRYGGTTLKRWGVTEPGASFSFQAGGLTGIVKVAVTALGEDGEESGCEPYIFTLDHQALTVSSTDPRRLRLYVSPPNHETLYFQTEFSGTAVITTVRDETERLVTHGLRPFPPCSMLVSHHGVIVGAYDRYVVCSEPMMPHLHNIFRRFFQYPTPVAMLAATDGGVFVGTQDATYFLSSLETVPSQRQVLGIGAVSGTAIPLPDPDGSVGRVAWFTRKGQAVGSTDGGVRLINEDRLAPDTADTGAAALVEHNGNRMLVTTMRGPVRTSGLGIGFHSDLET